MIILHIGIASSFTEGMSYQDNILPAINVKDGHEVIYISDCSKYVDGKLVETEEEDILTNDGFMLTRLKYDKIINKFISGKIRRVKKLYKIIEEIRPDVILFHGCAGYEIINVAKYVKNNNDVKFYVDSHEDINNSGTNWLSLNVLHKIFYRFCNKKALPYINKILYLSEESKDFLLDIYKLPEVKMEFYPLGGILFSVHEREEKRIRKRNELSLTDRDILLVHSGKMDKLKRTEEILQAFKQVKSDNIKLAIIGTFSDDVKELVFPLIESDNRINYLGWKSSDELMEYLCASDLYVQPGGQSATMQNAICCGSPVALYPHKSHKAFIKGNGYYVESIEDMIDVFNDVINNPYKIEKMRNNSLKIAYELLDYNKLAARLYE